MIKPKPRKVSLLFNSNYYFTSGDYLYNSGNQRLRGVMTDNGQVSYGDETIYGESTMRDEPLIMSISNPETLVNNNLVSKSYTDYRVLRPANEPVVSTLLTTNQLTNNHLVSKKYVDDNILTQTTEPVVVTRTEVNLLTNNHLVSKKYVDDTITTSVSLNLYPTNFYFGKSYIQTNPLTLQIENGMSFIKFKRNDFSIYTVVFNIIWNYTRSPSNSKNDVFFGNEQSSLYLRATYACVFFYNVATSTWNNTTKIQQVDGNTLHTNLTIQGIQVRPVLFGLTSGQPSVQIGFPVGVENTFSTNAWFSSWSCSIDIENSSSDIINQVSVNSNNSTGSAYFSKTI
jgi:hypothetical protein